MASNDSEDRQSRAPAGWGTFFGWVLVGALGALGLLSLLTIGAIFLVIAIVLTVVLVRRNRGSLGALGLISGIGVPLLYIASLNKDGPGTVCYTNGECTGEASPWPFLAAGVLFLVAGVWLFAVRSGRPRPPPSTG